MDKRDILQVLSCLDRGGIETWLLNVLRLSPEIRARSVLCLTGQSAAAKDNYFSEINRMGIPWVRIPYKQGAGRLLFIIKLARFIRKNRIRCVHCHMNHLSALGVAAAYSGGAEKRIAHYHQVLAPEDKKGHRIFFISILRILESVFATVIIGNSACTMRSFDRYWEKNEKKKVVYCGINTEIYRNPDREKGVLRRLQVPDNAKVIGHIGRFTEEKNHSFLLKVAYQIARVRPDIRFLLVGDGPLRLEIERKVLELGLKDRFVFTGYSDDVPRLLNAMDVFLLPSIYEGFGIVLLEAQAAGIPCIVSDTVTLETDVVPGLVHYLPLAKGDVYWAHKVLEKLKAGAMDRKACLAAIEKKGYSILNSIARLKEIYQA